MRKSICGYAWIKTVNRRRIGVWIWKNIDCGRQRGAVQLKAALDDEYDVTVVKTSSFHLHRNTDFPARYGGEEFVGIFLGDSSEKIYEHLKKVRQTVENLHIPHNPSVAPWVTVSMGGVTVVPPAESSYAVYLKVADTMLYDAQKQGRNRVIWADEQMRRLGGRDALPSGQGRSWRIYAGYIIVRPAN